LYGVTVNVAVVAVVAAAIAAVVAVVAAAVAAVVAVVAAAVAAVVAVAIAIIAAAVAAVVVAIAAAVVFCCLFVVALLLLCCCFVVVVTVVDENDLSIYLTAHAFGEEEGRRRRCHGCGGWYEEGACGTVRCISSSSEMGEPEGGGGRRVLLSSLIRSSLFSFLASPSRFSNVSMCILYSKFILVSFVIFCRRSWFSVINPFVLSSRSLMYSFLRWRERAADCLFFNNLSCRFRVLSSSDLNSTLNLKELLDGMSSSTSV